jgi:oxygen-independent coproporphyrinogen-3 oxidase
MVIDDIIYDAQQKTVDINAEELIRIGFLPKNGLFFPSILYPPVIKNSSITEEAFFTNYQRSGSFVVYAHIPFCVKRCNYCHYVTKTAPSFVEIDAYLNALEQEMDLYLKRLSLSKIPTAAVLIGGGTATHMTPAQMERFLLAFTKRLDLSSCEQFAVDTDPTTILGAEGIEKIKTLVRYGANRITIGVQTFDDALLTKMNRSHTADEARSAIRSAREHGFNDICVDLIYGYPGQTLEGWVDTIRHVIELDVESFQIYQLYIRPHCFNYAPIWVRYNRSPDEFPGIDDLVRMKAAAIFLANNYGYHDEQHNYLFSKENNTASQYFEKRFARSYDTLGFGLSAHNKLGGSIAVKEYASITRYCSEVAAGRIPFVRGKVGTLDDILRRMVIGTLRNRRLLSKEEYRASTGSNINDVFAGKIDLLKKHGLLTEDEKQLYVTQRGYYFADALCFQFHHPDHMPFERSDYSNGELNPYAS